MASFTVPSNTVDNARKTLVGSEIGTIEVDATLTVSVEEQTIRFNGPTNGPVVKNSGTVENTRRSHSREACIVRLQFGLTDGRMDGVGDVASNAVLQAQMTCDHAIESVAP